MIDDQDMCEWVNISSGTGSPWYSWTKGHKTVVVDEFIQVNSCTWETASVNSVSVTVHCGQQ